MIINSQFFITIYTGKEPLSLMTMPASFQTDPNKKSDYERFIQSIDTIYGSQTINGDIPKFWTRRTQKTNALGSVSYYYEPHPDSTLTQLDSKASYYFILRDSSYIPVRIPSNGGSLLGFTDASLLPQISKTENISLTDKTKTSISINITDLQPFEEYKYSFDAVSANWPVMVTPTSGILKPAKSSGTIESVVSFCPTLGSCASGAMDYILDDTCLTYGIKNYNSTMRLSIEPLSYEGSEVYGDQFAVACDDCLPKIELTMVSMSPKNVVDSDTSTTTPSYSFYINANNLNGDDSYTYSIEVLSADWPVVFTTPTGGTLKKSTPRADSRFYFCPTTGLCPAGDDGIPEYSIPSYPKFLTGETPYYIKLRASLIPDNCPGETVYSPIDVISFIR